MRKRGIHSPDHADAAILSTVQVITTSDLLPGQGGGITAGIMSKRM
jgi:hypothetical protein